MKNMFDTVSTFIGPPTLTGRVLWIRVHPSVLLSWSFLGIGWLCFSKTQDVVRSPCGVLRDGAEFFEKIIFFDQKMWKMGPKYGFLNLFENFVINFFWIFSEFILFVVFLHKSHTWEKSDSRDIGQNLLSQSDCRIFKYPISL